MTRTEAEDYVYQSYLRAEKYHDFYAGDREKRKPGLSKPILERMSKTPCVIVTGSKGKGSTAKMISQILQSQMRVGLMTSPHITHFCERFQVDGVAVSDDDFARIMESVKQAFAPVEQSISDGTYISPIGIQAAFALEFFGEKKTGFNVFECGKGAKYDDVCNIPHTYAVIGSIFLEHTRELGATIEEIASDKAHVIDGTQKCVYVAEQEPSVRSIIEQRAALYQTQVKHYGKDFSAENIRYTKAGMLFDVKIGDDCYHDICVPLLGEHQAKNCALALAISLDILENQIGEKEKLFDMNRIKELLKMLFWPGRMEVLFSKPFVMLDACINAASCNNIKNVLEHLDIKNYNLIVGIPDDKDYFGVVKALADDAKKIVLTKSQNKHYVFTEIQKEKLSDEGISTQWTDSLEKAVNMMSGEEIPLLILGTTSLVSEVKKLQNEGFFRYEV